LRPAGQLAADPLQDGERTQLRRVIAEPEFHAQSVISVEEVHVVWRECRSRDSLGQTRIAHAGIDGLDSAPHG
jgi:hypothetical protein